jgi:PAS domain S-box-containing protein
MRDLVALSTLPAVWVGLGSEGVARSLADVLLNTLSLHFVYVRLGGTNGEGVVVVRGHPAEVEAVREAVAPLLDAGRAEAPATMPDPSGDGTVHVAVTRFGVGGDHGILVAGSRDPDFPTDQDRLLLGVGANQTAIVVQRRRAEEQVREQRERLRVTLASIGDAVISTDAQGRVTFMNAVAEGLTGWPQAEALGRPLPDVFHVVNEETRRPAENPALRALREGAIVGLANSTVLVARDGTERPIDDSAAPIRDEAGERAGAVLVFRDVTERRRADELLRGKEAELRDFVENATVGLHWVGPDGTILWANRAELELLGYAREEYVGRNIVDFHVDRAVIDDILRRLLNREEVHGREARLRCKDGSVRHVLTDSSGLWEGDRFLHTRCFTHDITDRKRAEEAQARLAAIVESSDDAIVSKTLDAVITSWNQGAERLFGYTAAEAVGRPITLIIPPERLDEEPAILERLRRGQRVEHFETVRVAKDGRRIDISLTISPVRDGGGRIVGASKIARDITERKTAEAALREQARLIREVAAAGLTIHSAGTLDSVLRVIAAEARRVLGARRAIASLTVGEGCEPVTSAVSTSGAYERWREAGIPPPVEGACAEVCRTNRPMRLTRAELEAHPAWQKAGGRMS